MNDRKLLYIGVLSTIFFVFIALVGPTIFLSVFKIKITFASLFYLSRLPFWFVLGFVYWQATRMEHSSILIAPQVNYSIVKIIVGILLILVSTFIAGYILFFLVIIFSLSTDSELTEQMRALSPIAKFTGAITAGITEELIVRGYLLTRLEKLYRHPSIALIITSVLFGLAHAGYGTVYSVIGTCMYGFIFGAFQQRYRNIYIVITAHILIDLIALFGKN